MSTASAGSANLRNPIFTVLDFALSPCAVIRRHDNALQWRHNGCDGV